MFPLNGGEILLYLKRIEIVGFKSFADRTELEFYPGVTAIVGPNGSGKSNISDCIRWVLGEQSAKSLRGSKMEDVIFAGSDTRKPVNYCEVSLTLDNTDQELPLEYNEVTVTRRVYRSGEGEYFINKQPCRLKDITELFMDTGLGKEAYSIIGQGRIEEILSTKAEDRRGIFEEAAGIVKYKARKREAEKKLEETEANLVRIGDVIAELEAQLGPLAEQADVAEHYHRLKEELDAIEIALHVHHIEDVHNRWTVGKEEGKRLEEQHLQQSAIVSQEEAKRAEMRWQAEQLEQEWETKNSRLMQIIQECEKMEGRHEVLRERIRNLLQGRDDLSDAQSKLAREKSRIEAERQQLQERLQDLRQNRAAFLKELEEKQGRVKEMLDRSQQEEELERLKADLIEILNETAGKRNENKNIQHQREMLLRRAKRLAEDEEALVARIRTLEETLAGLEEQVQAGREEESSLDEQLLAQKEWLRRQGEQKQELETSLREMQNEFVSCRSRYELLRDMQEEYGGYNMGVRHILQAARAGKVQGVCGAVAERIQVPASYETAMETALGSALQHVIVETEKAGREAIHYLKRNNGGRATFLPLDVIRGRTLGKAERQAIEGHAGFVGVAAEMVACEEKYREVIRYLLGGVIVARTIADANELARILQYRHRVVTLDGDLVNPGGSMTGGSIQKKGTSLLGRQREMDELKQKLDVLRQSLEEGERQMKEIDAKAAQVQKALLDIQERMARKKEAILAAETAIREVSAEKRALEERVQLIRLEREQCRKEIREWESRQQQIEDELVRLDQQAQELSRNVNERQTVLREQIMVQEDLSEELTEVKVKLAGIDQEIHSAEENIRRLQQRDAEIAEEREGKEREQARIAERLQQTKQEMEECAARLQEMLELRSDAERELEEVKERKARLGQSIADMEHRVRESRIVLRNLENQIHENEIRVNRLDVELANALGKLAEEYQMSFEWAKEHYPLPEDLAAAKNRASVLRKEIGELGDVNLGAIDEYKRVRERYLFLGGQREDLVEAKSKLYDVIRDIEAEMSKRFHETFSAIRIQFTDVFAQLFGGGKADLLLADPENLLTTGIEIVAQPPGKKLQNLNLLSGGERALTAIALLFAILRVKPVPFCVLDEVEAALDEANVTRFAEYLREFSAQTQFIVITHRKGTMEGADVLYGVTMEESGVSKLVSVRLVENEAQSA
jgi:chromosome segregation protein